MTFKHILALVVCVAGLSLSTSCSRTSKSLGSAPTNCPANQTYDPKAKGCVNKTGVYSPAPSPQNNGSGGGGGLGSNPNPGQRPGINQPYNPNQPYIPNQPYYPNRPPNQPPVNPNRPPIGQPTRPPIGQPTRPPGSGTPITPVGATGLSIQLEVANGAPVVKFLFDDPANVKISNYTVSGVEMSAGKTSAARQHGGPVLLNVDVSFTYKNSPFKATAVAGGQSTRATVTVGQ